MTTTEDFMTNTPSEEKVPRKQGKQGKQGPYKGRTRRKSGGSILGWWTHSLLETIYLRWALLAGDEALTGRGHRQTAQISHTLRRDPATHRTYSISPNLGQRWPVICHRVVSLLRVAPTTAPDLSRSKAS